MTFALDDHWVWDFWLADDGLDYHLYYLHAPKSLEDPDLRHRNARIGHATSEDLTTWIDKGPVLGPGEAGAFDETATWTGSVVRGDDGVWRMFYTGASFHHADSHRNIETIGVATSVDLHTWTKGGLVLSADARWYEKLDDSDWPEEAWRDPWVFRDGGGTWHMLVTARSRAGIGVIGHAVSPDLESWETLAPLPGADPRFAHLEVLQIAEVAGEQVLVFSASTGAVAGEGTGGIWILDDIRFPDSLDLAGATLLAGESLYSGKILTNRLGDAVLLAFEQGIDGEPFVGRIADPIPLARDDAGVISLGPRPTRPLVPSGRTDA